ncbi:peptidoglycan recognition protein [Microplitis demolitor]|uniref:peptidoglycan recognition protein n=1 Tax=Microplitis demolitor TaxID=69319 RepID=UPI00235B633C|nr:peptidoglycan recognition protein [Microplitis demolitor]
MFKLSIINYIFSMIIIVKIDGYFIDDDGEFSHSLVNENDYSPDKLVFVSRTEWKALSMMKPLEKLDVIPTPYVMIYHTGSETCFYLEACAAILRRMQAQYMVNYPGDRDIGFNFVISGDGSVYVGRGWNTVGAHTLGLNRKSIGIALIGTFYDKSPSANQIFTLINLIKYGVNDHHIDIEFKYYSYPDISIFMTDNKLANITHLMKP